MSRISRFSRLGRLSLGVVIAAGAVFGAAQITSGSTNSTKETVFVGLLPSRLLDTRENAITFDGFDQAVGRLDADTTYELDIADRAGIPTSAASVTANLVAVNPSGPGYLTVYPCGVDRPLASALNYQISNDNANEFTVPLSADGDICIYTHAETDLVVDIYGYYTASTETGTQGPAGPQGPAGQDAESPDRVVWVADDGTGDFTSLSLALASIKDATATKPYVVKIAPGAYKESANVAMKDYVDVEGSGQGITTIKCECSGSTDVAKSTISIGEVNVEIRQITIKNSTVLSGEIFAVHSNQNLNVDKAVTMADVTATATEGTLAVGINLNQSTLKLRNVTATASNGASNYGIKTSASNFTIETTVATASGGTNLDMAISIEAGSTAALNNVIAEATSGSSSNEPRYGIYASSSVVVAHNVTATASGGSSVTGVYAKSGSVVDIGNSTATAKDGTSNTGIGVTSGSQATLNDVTATGSGAEGTSSKGIAVDGGGSILNAFNTKARGSAGESGYGALVSTGAEASFSNSVLDGKGEGGQQGKSISNAGTANIVNTRFEPDGIPVKGTGGTFNCQMNYFLNLSAGVAACTA